MPRNIYVGTTISLKYPKSNYCEKQVTFEQIINHPRLQDNKLKKPNYQGALNETKCEQMVEEYIENPALICSKNKIVIGCLNDSWYIIDGQHRLEASKMLKKNHNIDDCLIFCYYECFTEKEMKKLFDSLNQDSIKNKYYINEDVKNDVKQKLELDFKKKLANYKEYFSKKENKSGRIKCIEEFVIELRNMNYYDEFENAQSAYDNLLEKNNLFYQKSNLKMNIIYNESNYVKQELKHLNEGIIFPLRFNNFLNFLKDEEIDVYHKSKIIKKKISQYIKKQVWNNQFGVSCQSNECPISWCKNILYYGVRAGWQCGHIISEYNGGATEPNNLRPICEGCNMSMGKKNWDDYDKSLQL